MSNNNALDNFFDTNFSNQELKARYEKFYKYLCENGIKRDFKKAKDLGIDVCFNNFGAIAFAVNFLHTGKQLDENDRMSEINAMIPVHKFKLTENKTKFEIEDAAHVIEKIFLAIMSVDPKIFDIKSFDFFMSNNIDAERYMKIYDAAWAARDTHSLIEKYLNILERNEKLDEEAEKHPNSKDNHKNLKVKLALNRDELAKVEERINQISLLRNYTVHLLDALFIHSDFLPIEISKFAKSDLWDMTHFKPINSKRGWQQAIMMRKSKDMGIKIIKSPGHEKKLTIGFGPRDFTLDAILALRDATLEKDIVKKLETNVYMFKEAKIKETEGLDKSEKELKEQIEEKIEEKPINQVETGENNEDKNKRENQDNLVEKNKIKKQIEEKEGKEKKDEEKSKHEESQNNKIQEQVTAQIKNNEKENKNLEIIPKANKEENLPTLTSQVKSFRDFSEFLSKLKDEDLKQNIISGLTCNNFSTWGMICAFVWAACHFWKIPKGIGVLNAARIKVAYDNMMSDSVCDNMKDNNSERKLTAIGALINTAIARSNKEKNIVSVKTEPRKQFGSKNI